MVYRAHDLETNPDTVLQRGGLVLIALISGGDYDDVSCPRLLKEQSRLTRRSKGVKGLGPTFAHGLARCGFGDELLAAYNSKTEPELRAFLPLWRQRMTTELKTNSRRFLTSKKNFDIPNDFPCLATLGNYARPLTTGERASPMRDRADLDLAALASFCEDYFEWATADGILKRFRSLVWPVAIMHVFRRSALEADRRQREGQASAHTDFTVGSTAALVAACLGPKKKPAASKNSRLDALGDVFLNQGTTPAPATYPQYSHPAVADEHPLVIKIKTSRCHASTDGLREFRLVYSPVQFTSLTRCGIRKFRPAPETKREPKDGAPPDSDDVLWMSEIVLKRVHPQLVDSWLTEQAEKGRKKPGRKRKEGQERGSSPAALDEGHELAGSQQPSGSQRPSVYSQPSGSQSRILSQIDAIRAPAKRKKRATPRSPQRPRPAPMDPISLEQPQPKRHFSFTFIDPGIHYDDDDDECSDSSPAPAAQRAPSLARREDAPIESPVRATAGVTALFDSIIDGTLNRSKMNGKRKAVAPAAAASQPAKKAKAPEIGASTHGHPAPSSSQLMQEAGSSRKVTDHNRRESSNDDSDIEVLSPRVASKGRGHVGARAAPLQNSSSSSTTVPAFRYGYDVPDFTDSDDDMELNFAPPSSSQTSRGHSVLDCSDIIDLT